MNAKSNLIATAIQASSGLAGLSLLCVYGRARCSVAGDPGRATRVEAESTVPAAAVDGLAHAPVAQAGPGRASFADTWNVVTSKEIRTDVMPERGGPGRASTFEVRQCGLKGPCGMKGTCGSSDGRHDLRQLSPNQHEVQSHQQMQQQTCQTMDSYKGPLKGKAHAVRQWLSSAEKRLVDVHSEMELLRQESKDLISDESPWSLDIYSITKRGAKSLRWRMTGGAHSRWEKIVPLLAYLAPASAQWYREANIRAAVLNAREQSVRYEIKTAKRLEQALDLL
ncbi:hypothetical protein [Aquabacterium parvum]|nr:hypothetical protein [Aquabacterium parvum]